MMNFIKKINRGAILTVLVLIGVVIYLMSIAIYNNSQVEAITKLCQEYIDVEVKYSMLPEKYRAQDMTISEVELKSYIAQMKTDISAYYPDNYKNYTVDNLASDLQNQANGYGTVLKYSKSPQVKKITFDGKNAVVSLVSDTVYQNSNTGNLSSSVTDDEVRVSNIDGKWYVTYSSLVTESYGFYGG